MSDGKKHDYLNIGAGALLIGVMLGASWRTIIIVPFSLGWLLATFIFSPDADIMPKKRTKVLRFVLYPYSIFFKHRGLSHSLLFGTLTRVFYVLSMLALGIFVLNKMGYIEFGPQGYFSYLVHFMLNYNYQEDVYKIVTWFYLGMFGADLLHLFLDKMSSIWGRFRRILG